MWGPRGIERASFAVGVVFDVHPGWIGADAGELLRGGDRRVGEVGGVFGLAVFVVKVGHVAGYW